MRRQVYIVDDDAQVRQSTCFLLRSHDFQCRTFPSGETFLDEVDRLEPGCVLLDIFMPGSSGLDVQADLARHASRLPVIAMSGHTDADLARSALDMGAVEVLEKPFAEESLLAALESGFARLKSAP
jgi:two-component system response regulator FixJ